MISDQNTSGTNSTFLPCEIQSPNVQYSESEIISQYVYHNTIVKKVDGKNVVLPKSNRVTFKTERKVPKVGVMLVGWGGNNGTTLTGGLIANRRGMKWHTRNGIHEANYIGSFTQMSTIKIGINEENQEVFVPFNSFVPLVNPNDIVVTGWDINGMSMGKAMERAEVFDYDIQRQLFDEMETMKPMPSIYDPSFIASNQSDRADNIIKGTKKQQMEKIREDIRNFKKESKVDKVIVLWTANTERFAEIGKHNKTSHDLMESIDKNENEIAPSTLFAVASILEGISFINGSPQNTLVPGVIELAEEKGVFIAGDDFKTGQTKIKSVLTDFLVSAGLKVRSIVSYNHLGNNDGKNLSSPAQFKSKETSKGSVIDDIIHNNGVMYKDGEKPDHCVVIKYIPFVKDSKRALDEYTSEIFMGGTNTIAMHNTCEDSLLAAPLMLDLIIMTEFMERVWYKSGDMDKFERFHPVLSILSYLLKAPRVPPGTPVINALYRQRQCIDNIMRALYGLPPDNNMNLEFKMKL